MDNGVDVQSALFWVLCFCSLMQKDCDKLFLRSHDLKKVSSTAELEIMDSNKELRKDSVYSNSDLFKVF